MCLCVSVWGECVGIVDEAVRTRTEFIIYGERERLMQELLMCGTFKESYPLYICVCHHEACLAPTDASFM